ncbi:MAG: FecR domain-containing protein [Pseudomonadota bacterium]
MAGNVQFVIGDVKLIDRAGESRALQKGAAINEGDRIVTAAGASAQIKMVDGGFIAIRPNTDMGFDTYRYSGKEDGTENAIVSLLQGGFRTITGIIGRTNRQNYLVRTETATIGIRGTDHEPMVILPPAPGQVAIAPPGTYDKVNVGIAYIRNDAGSVDIHRNQVGFAPETKALPMVLPKIPLFYKPTPAPGPQKAAAPATAGEEQKAEAPAQIRDTAVVDPTSTVTAAPAATTVAAAPVAVAPVVAITATDASGTTLNTTTQTQTTSTGVTAPITSSVVTSFPSTVLVANYGYSIAGGYTFGGGQTYWVTPPVGSLVTDAAGNLVSVTEGNNSMHGDDNAVALSGGTAYPATPIALAIGSAATATDGTILLGWRAPTPSLTVSGIDFNGCFGTSGCIATARTVLGDGLSWVKGPAPFPDYLPGATDSMATYNLGASILHDQTGATGTVNSAWLTVDFTHASVDFDMAATTAAGNWTAFTPTPIRMNQDGTFYAYGSSGGTPTLISGTTVTPGTIHDNLSVTLNSSSMGTWGNISGQLMGSGLSGAGVTYDLNSLYCPGPCNVTASGALAFSNTLPLSTQTPYQLVAFVTGMNAAGEFDPAENSRIQGGFVAPSRVQTDVNGFPVKMDGELPVAVTYGSPCTINCGPYINNIPVEYAVAGASPPSIGTATLLQSGSDPATGISWGRYGGGTIGVNDRISGASLGTVDATLQNVHFIMSAAQSVPTVLPLTGTFNYTFAGGTFPTDSNGNVGAALTAAKASLTANFSTQKVDATLSNLVVGGNTWGASATGIPIQGNVFQAEKNLGGGGNLTVTSTLGTNTAGVIAGGFTGATGNGVGMLYSLNHGGNIVNNSAAVTVSGVAAFRR